jgi:uncharacterized protein (DUF302 family)
MAVDGLITRQSRHTPPETMKRLIEGVSQLGVAVLAHIDHAAAAAKAGLELRPTDLLIFGNAKAGTPLMAARQTMGIDLPLKMQVWQDADGKTWLGYNDPLWLARRHGALASSEPILLAMHDLLAALAEQAGG